MLLHGGEPIRYLEDSLRRRVSTSAQVKLLIEEFKLPSLRVNGTIIDIETTDLYPDTGELITFGYISGSKLKSMTRTKEIHPPKFWELVRRELATLRPPFYAYNKEFEQRWFDYHGLPFSWRDLMDPLKRNANIIRDKTPYKVKWSKLHEAFPMRVLRYFGLRDFDVENEEIGKLWDEHLETGSTDPLMVITQHNVLDLLTEASTLIWETTLNKLSESFQVLPPSELTNQLSFRCDVCDREVNDSTELVYTQRVERRSDGTYRLVEAEVCKECFKKLF